MTIKFTPTFEKNQQKWAKRKKNKKKEKYK